MRPSRASKPTPSIARIAPKLPAQAFDADHGAGPAERQEEWRRPDVVDAGRIEAVHRAAFDEIAQQPLHAGQARLAMALARHDDVQVPFESGRRCRAVFRRRGRVELAGQQQRRHL